MFIAVSDLANFVKDVNNCVCLNPGKLVKGVSTGAYAQILIKQENQNSEVKTEPSEKNITVTFHKM